MPSKTQSILLGAAIGTVLGLVQLFLASNGGTAGQYLSSAVCCLTAVFGAGGAVWHYTSTHRLTIPAGTGATMGSAALVLGAVVSGAIGWLLQLVGVVPSDEVLLERARQQALEQNPNLEPEQLDQIMQFTETMSGPLGMVAGIVVMALLGAIVGAIAASVFKKGAVSDDLDAV